MKIKKTITLPLTVHFSLEPEDIIGQITFHKGAQIPADSVFVLGLIKVEQKKTKDVVEINSVTMMPDEHYKAFLDHFPESCINAGGHIRGINKRCQICKTKM